MELSEHAASNRRVWDAASDEYQKLHAGQLDAQPLAWGVWSWPEAELQVLDDVNGRDVLELGCGAAQWAVALAELGACVVGLDNSSVQLDHARRRMKEHGVDFPLVHASGESVPYPDDSFDIVFCDHGAMSFCDPRLTVPEAARLLRPGGQLAFNMASPLFSVCYDDDAGKVSRQLSYDYFGLHRITDPEDGMVEFQLPYGEWIRLFRDSGFVVEDLIELRASDSGASTYRSFADHEWSRRWPAENIWKLRRRG